MTITVEAVYENGVLKSTRPLPLREHEIVEILIRTPAAAPSAADTLQGSYGLIGWKGSHEELEQILAEAGSQGGY